MVTNLGHSDLSETALKVLLPKQFMKKDREKHFTSINDVTFSAMERGVALFGKTIFAMDRGYDDNKMFLKLDELKQDYVIRLTAKRKLFFHEK